MDEKLREILNDGEQVLWSGSPAPFALLDRHAGNWRKILIEWNSVAVLASALIIVYMMNNDPVSPGFLTVVIGISLLLILSPLVDRYNILGTRYWITDQRVILMQRSKTIFSMRLDCVDAFRLVQDEAPNDCLVLGSRALEDVGRQLRWRSSHPADQPGVSSDNNAVGLVLYNVANLEDAVPLLGQAGAA